MTDRPENIQTPKNVDTPDFIGDVMGKRAAPTEESTRPGDSDRTMTPEQVADSIIKNQGYGHGKERANIEEALGRAMDKSLQTGGDEAKKFAHEVNQELAQKMSKFHIDENISGGGSSWGKGDTRNEHSEAAASFRLKEGDAEKDKMPMHASYDKVMQNGKVVGERSAREGEFGGGGGGWGKQPENTKGNAPLHDVIIEEGGGGSQSKGGGKGGRPGDG